MYVSHVEKFSFNPVDFRNMKEFILGRNPMCVKNVGKPCPLVLPLDIMKGFTVGRNPTFASYVIRPLLRVAPFTIMKRFTLERNPVFVSTVGNVSFNPMNFMNMEKTDQNHMTTQ
jgi:hypothetical protein